MIEAAKRAINAVLRDTDVNDEELVTAFIGVEALLNSRPTPTNFFSFRCEGAVMAANARTFLSLLLIYVVSNIYFQTKTSETHLFGTNNSPAAPRIAIRERNLEYFAVVLQWCGKSKLQLTSMGYHKLSVAAIRWGKRGNTTLAVPGHDPPFEITIFNDIALNPGPATSVENRVQPGNQVIIEHRSENLLRAPILTYSRQQLMDLRRQHCLPSLTAITLLKQCGIFKFRGPRGGRYRRIQRDYANFFQFAQDHYFTEP